MDNINDNKIYGDFISLIDFETYDEQVKKIGGKYNLDYLRNKMSYEKCRCPRCNMDGYFKIHLLGKIYHEECGWLGYAHWLEYLSYQISYSYYASRKIRYSTSNDNSQGLYLFNLILGMLWALIRFLYIGIPLLIINVSILLFKLFYKK